jgi:hypothetical protein
MNIEKEFVPYQPSLDMKELGFDEPCFAFYQIEYAEVIPTMVDDNEQYKLTGFRTCKNSEIPEHYTSAPTFSQCFRWFREKYLLFGYPFPNDYQKYGYRIVEITSDENKELVYDWGTKDSVEEAELACLRKLIEIVKSK